MPFRVEVTPRAIENLDYLATYIHVHGSYERAEKWLNEMIDALASLARAPSRCAVAKESEALGQEVRLLLFGRRNRRYKVFFLIERDTPTSGTVQGSHGLDPVAREN